MAMKKKTAAEKLATTKARVTKWRTENPEYYKGYMSGLRASRKKANKIKKNAK